MIEKSLVQKVRTTPDLSPAESDVTLKVLGKVLYEHIRYLDGLENEPSYLREFSAGAHENMYVEKVLQILGEANLTIDQFFFNLDRAGITAQTRYFLNIMDLDDEIARYTQYKFRKVGIR